tara:strand:- start:281 stop:463 length:183 start_codon:yes stop_codon:yes gene_type:complete
VKVKDLIKMLEKTKADKVFFTLVKDYTEDNNSGNLSHLGIIGENYGEDQDTIEIGFEQKY